MSDGPGLPEVLPETYYSAAEEALPQDLLHCHDFDHLRGYALLAIASIQDAQIPAMQKYIGQYFTILAINQWHDESFWPQGLHSGEIEERRRVVSLFEPQSALLCLMLTRSVLVDVHP
jgi:hypothetical protein